MIFIFETNKENNQVKFSLELANKLINLGHRKHNLIIFQLAQQKARDIQGNKDVIDQGYLFKDWLYDIIHPDENTTTLGENLSLDYTTVNQHFSRFKQQVNQALQLNEPQDFIEHRVNEEGSQVRFIPEQIRIIEGGSVKFDTSNICRPEFSYTHIKSDNSEIATSDKQKLEVEPLEALQQKQNKFIGRAFSKVNTKLTLIFATILVVIFTSFFQDQPLFSSNKSQVKLSSVKDINHFVFLEPVFKRQDIINLEQQNNLRESLLAAVLSYSNKNKNVKLIQIVNNKNATIQETGEKFTADSVISALINCKNKDKCSFSLKKFDKKQEWQATNSFNLPLSPYSLENMFWGVQFKLDAFFTKSSKHHYAPPEGVDSESFNQFVNIYSLWQQGKLTDDLLEKLTELIVFFPNWQFAINTYHNLLKDFYINSNNVQYLHQLELSINRENSALIDNMHTLTVNIFLDRVRGNYTDAHNKVALLGKYGATDKEINEQRAMLYLAQREWPNVISVYKGVHISELDYKNFNLLKKALWQAGNYEFLDKLTTEYLSDYPDCHYAINTKIQLALMQGNLDDALILHKGLNIIDANNAHSRAILADIYYLQGKPHKAQQLLQANFNDFPRNINTIDNLARFYLLQQQPNQAKKLYSMILKSNDKDHLTNAPIKMAFAYATNDKLSLAKKIVTEQEIYIKTNNIKSPFLQLRIAEFHAIFGDSSLAFQHAEAATKHGLDKIYFQQNIFTQLCISGDYAGKKTTSNICSESISTLIKNEKNPVIKTTVENS